MAAYEQTITVKVKIEPADERSRRFLELLTPMPTIPTEPFPSHMFAAATSVASSPSFMSAPGEENNLWRYFTNTDTTGEDE